MLAFYLYKYLLEEIWWIEEENFCDFLRKCLATIFCIIPCIAVLIADVILLPIEIIILIIYIVKIKKERDDKK